MRYRRSRIAGATYFFTVVAHERRPVLVGPRVLSALRAAFRREQAAGHLSLDAIVVLPDHLHCIWTTPADSADFPGAWRRIKAAVSRACADKLEGSLNPSRRAKGERGLWQRRYWEHAVRDEDDLRRHLDYVHFNPVRHGYVATPAAWPHSSFRRFVRRGLYPESWSADPGEIARE
jgi:putative transposase